MVGDIYTFGSSGDFITLQVASSNVNATWTTNGSSNWNNPGNWTPGIPHIAADTANFTTDGGTITAATVAVTLDANETVGAISFNAASTAYSIVQGGSNTLTMDATSGGVVTIADTNGNDSIGVPISLNGSLGVSVASSSDTLSISGNIANGTAAAPTLTMSGAGTAVLTGANTYGGGSSVTNTIISGGTLQLGDGATAGSVIGPISVAASATLAIDLPASSSFTNVVTGSGTLASLATTTLSTANPSFSGTTVASMGTLSLTSAAPLGTGGIGAGNAALVGTGTFDLSGLSLTVNGISGYANGIIDEVSSTADVTLTDSQTTSTTFAGAIQNSQGPGAGEVSLSMTGSGTLDLTGPSTYTGSTSVTSGTLEVGPGGSLNTGSGIFTLNGGTLVVNGGTVTTTGIVGLQTNNTEPSGFITIGAGNTGGNVSFGGVAIGSGSSLSTVTIDSGTVSLGAFTDDRDSTSATGSTTTGLIVNGGTVTATSAQVGNTNSSANVTVNGGSLTIGDPSSTGAFLVGNGTSGRYCDLTVTDGSLTYLGTDGLILCNTATEAQATISGGTVTVTGITLNSVAASSGTTTSSLTLGGGNLYVGSVGIVENTGATATAAINLNGGTIGAIAPWSSSAPMTIGGPVTIQAADASNNPNNISLSGALSGGGGLTIAGPGTVAVSGSNTYGGGTIVNSGGTLLVNSTDNVNGGTGAGALSVNGTLGGSGNTNSEVTINSGGTLAPGGALAPGNGAATLTVNNSLALANGANLNYLLNTQSATGPVAGGDFTQVNGGLTINPNLTINVVPGPGFLATGVYDLIQYDSGGLTDNSSGYSGWTVTGVAPGTHVSFSTDPGNFTLSLVAPSAPAAPGTPDYLPPYESPTPLDPSLPHFAGYNENVTNTSGAAQNQVNIVLNGNFTQAGDVIGNYPTFGAGTTYTTAYNATNNTTTITITGTNSIPAGHVAHVGYSLLNGTGGGEMESPETAYKYWGTPQSTPGANLRLPAPSWFVSNPGQGPNTVFLILYSTIELSNGTVAGEWDEQQVPATGPLTINLGNFDDLDGPMFAFNVGFQLSSTEIPLDDLNNVYEPPSDFTPLPGIPDATPIDPGRSVMATIDLPEPASLSLVAVGAAGLMRRRRKSSAK